VAEKEQFYSFEEALKELRLKEEELKRLVSEGEIRAFREGDTMRLRRSDVETLKSELSGGEVIDLDTNEELVFEDDSTEATGMATEAISDVETILDESGPAVTEEIAIEEEAPAAESEIEPEPVAAAAAASAAAYDEGEVEGAGFKALLVLTTLVLLLGVPLALSASRGEFSTVAQTIAGLFGQGPR